MKILILNAGSSSLKFQLMETDSRRIAAKGMVERIGIEGSVIKQTAGDKIYKNEQPMKDHDEAIAAMMRALTHTELGALKDMGEIAAVGHRVLHGGEKFSASVIINEAVIEAIRENIPLGPLHNPANLMGILACRRIMPDTPQVAVFDTSFHQTMPKKAYLYGIPTEYYKRLKIRRYGFHGTSHRYVSARVCQFLGINPIGTRIITCHLGNGSSLAAVVDGKCVDTSMGLTPLEGVLMGTRSGSLDPAVVQFIANSEGLTCDAVLDILNKKSGLIGVSGVSSDMRDIDAAADSGNEDAIVARDMLAYSIKKYIGAYAAAMGGVDVLVFTAGIGENNWALRRRVMEDMEWLGVKMDFSKNDCLRAQECVISADDSRVKVVVIPTDEEMVIASDTLELVHCIDKNTDADYNDPRFRLG
ncbi:MAG: acetate kinase [Clostridia bacterium]|nr:acetate kinase [Clostridia bacterium]